MSLLSKLSHTQNRRDEILNQELARELAEDKNLAGFQEIADNLFHEDRKMGIFAHPPKKVYSTVLQKHLLIVLI